MTSRPPSAISLAAAVYGFVMLGAILFGLATTYLLFDRIEKARASALEEAVVVRGRHAALDLAKVLEQDWQSLKRIADRVPLTDLNWLEVSLEQIVGDGERISWAGFARPDGLVIAASNGVLKGADVASRPWFQRGLSGDFAGDVHDAVLLNTILGGTIVDPLRFIDLAAKVEGADAQTAGVIGLQINFAWAEMYLADTARSLGLDLYLVSQGGDVIIATDGSPPGSRGLQSFRAAAAGVAQSNRETWPDGNQYFTTVIPNVTYGDLPSFGWRLVARIAPDAFDMATTDLIRALVQVLAAAFFFLLILTVAFNRIFIHPFALLADNAKRIADGSDDYPLELRRTHELQRLSAALAQLQGRGD